MTEPAQFLHDPTGISENSEEIQDTLTREDRIMLGADDMREPGNDTWLWWTMVFGAGVVTGILLVYMAGYL